MGKVIKTLICGIFLLSFISCGDKEKYEKSLTFDKVNNKIIEYFKDEDNDRSNLSFNYIDNENNVIVVGLIDNSREKQDEFLKNIFNSKQIIFIKSKNLISFVKGGKNTTSNH